MASLPLHFKSHHYKPSQFILKSTSSNLTFSLLFSSSSSSDNSNNNNGGGNPSDNPHPFSSYFDDIKSKLKHHEEQRQQQQQSSGFRYSNTELNTQGSTNLKVATSFDEVRKNLSEFRRRSTVPPPGFEQRQQQQQSALFQSGNAGNPNANSGGKSGGLSFSAIRESLRKVRGTVGVDGSNTSDRMSLINYKKNLKLQPKMAESGGGSGRGGGGGGGKVIGGSTENLPISVFGKEMKEKETKTGKAGDGEDDESCFELFNMYTHDELGKKLKELRPEVKGKEEGGKEENWFSISELGNRLKKLKGIEENQSSGVFSELRKSLSSLSGKDNKPKNAPIQSLGLLSPSNFTEYPPQEHLVEKYFHPDNMSAEEKLKIELKKVRDEFKMHESDCGSTRVQIAQLTTEILHLSSVLHKKDKHSRRGLQAKVQQRKKLLKYLRRTDWESYCFVLSKLGLRDNPDYKN